MIMVNNMKNDSLLYRYKKALKNSNQKDESETRKIHYNYINKLFFRIFLSTLILLCLVIIDKISMNIKKIRICENSINKSWNFLNLVTTFNGMFGEFIVIDETVEVDNKQLYDDINYIQNINVITNTSINGVIICESGVVTKILKDEDKLYTVEILSNDDVLYCYSNLSTVDVSIYTYIEAGNIIGEANSNNGKFTFNLTINKDGKYYEYNDMFKD